MRKLFAICLILFSFNSCKEKEEDFVQTNIYFKNMSPLSLTYSFYKKTNVYLLEQRVSFGLDSHLIKDLAGENVTAAAWFNSNLDSMIITFDEYPYNRPSIKFTPQGSNYSSNVFSESSWTLITQKNRKEMPNKIVNETVNNYYFSFDTSKILK